MTVEAQKLELIQWIASLDNQQLLQQIAELKQQALPPMSKPKREFGFGRHAILRIADDFNAPLDDFKEYMPE